ncbi:enoyl-CoA hydratase/isomerase family protein, partial [Mesorhizobium sp. M2A.F.Ca.ET.037.01.1.1]|uniref:enoyl-CoA hydratase/isomerase family protein n=1 Tax=Mesorhizobium sp. M2A.F.Ca.ET.037.01.1.1 TaxID=2496748 RepID=UPI000FD1E255
LRARPSGNDADRGFGAQIVRRMAIGGEIFLAADALADGIVDRLVETGKAFDEARSWAEKIAERGPLATEAAKLMIGVAEGEEDAAATEALASGFIALTGDLKAGVGAFKARQKPAFSRS